MEILVAGKYGYDQGSRTAEEDVPGVVAHVVSGEDMAGHCTFDTFPRDLASVRTS